MNILYFHTHDLGRICSPYGYGVQTPNMLRFAREGVLFRNAFCAAPTCSPSRATLLTGQYPHQCGMFGLTNQGWRLNDYSRHLAAYLGSWGYETAVFGSHHVVGHDAEGYARLPYDIKTHLDPETAIGNRLTTTDEAIAYLKSPKDKPFFLALGYDFNHHHRWETARECSESLFGPIDDRHIRPLPIHPDLPLVREESALFYNAIRYVDYLFGRILDILKETGLEQDTLVIFTTDHGIGLPNVKKNLLDWGTGVALMLRGPAGLSGGRVFDSLVHHIDLYPTLCELTGAPKPDWLAGSSLMPIINGGQQKVHDYVFTEQNYHGNFAALRAVRDRRYKYIRRIGEAQSVLSYNADRGKIYDFWVENGWGDVRMPEEQLYDLYFDPNEVHNVVEQNRYQPALDELRSVLDQWMVETSDPARTNTIPKPPKG